MTQGPPSTAAANDSTVRHARQVDRIGAPWGRVKFIVALAVAASTLWSAPPGIQFWDTSTKLQIAQNVLDGKGAFLTRPTPDDAQYVVIGRAGRAVSQYPVLSWVVQIPTVLMARAGGRVFEGLPTLLALVWLSTLLIEWGRRARATPNSAAFGSLVACLGTALWPTAALGYDSIFVALALALIAVMTTGEDRPGRWSTIGLCIGAAFCLRKDGLLLAPAAVWIAARQLPRGLRPFAGRVLSGIAGAVPCLLISAAYNSYRFGEVVRSKPMSDSLLAPVLSVQHLRGMLGLTLSPGKGIIWFGVPVVASLVLLTRGTPGSFRKAAAVVLLYLGSSIPLLGAFSNWHGDWCWGPRYAVAAYLLAAPAAWESWRRFSTRPWSRTALVAIATGAVALQALPVIGRPVGTYLQYVVVPLAREDVLATRPVTKPPLPVDNEPLYFRFENAIWLRHPQAVLRALRDPEERPAVLRDALRALAVPMAAMLVILLLLRSEVRQISRDGVPSP